MHRLIHLLSFLTLSLAFAPARRALAQPPGPAPEFVSPYASDQPLESFLVFSAPPRANVPDGQVHWVDLEVPGIDVLGPDGVLRNMCPEGGLAWTLAEGDLVGGGGRFVAVECSGSATGWQFLAFHLCEVHVGASITSAQRRLTQVPAGGVLAAECGHTHLSLGYWARPEQKLDLPCPQWYVQGRYWVNPACLATARALPVAGPLYLLRADDWELRLLRPEVLDPLRRAASSLVIVGLALYLVLAWGRRASRQELNRRLLPAYEATIKGGIWIGFIVLLIVASAGPIWPVARRSSHLYTTEEARYQALAAATGYKDWRLLMAFYRAAVPRTAAGRPARAAEPGKVFPPQAAAAIPFGETDADDWGLADPTQPGTHGRFLAWEAVTNRWPISIYERSVLGLQISRTAQRQRDGLIAIAGSPAVIELGRRLGKTIGPTDLYGSSAGAVGRTQILPGHFAPGGLCADLASMDVWNDPQAIAECTTRYLTANGCWGSWWANGDVWSALCGYNPGAWGVARDAWYWDVLQDRMTRLTAAGDLVQAAAPGQPAADGGERWISTPVLGMLLTEALLQNGSRYDLPARLEAWAEALGPWSQSHRELVRGAYRVFRAWTLIYYSSDELARLGIQSP